MTYYGRLFLMVASSSGMLAVALGAFGAHGLRSRLAPDMLAVYQTAVQYHFYHTAALLACALLMNMGVQGVMVRASGWSFIAGILLFSGSLYLMAITGVRWLGAITPIGGIAFMAGWLLLALAAWRHAV